MAKAVYIFISILIVATNTYFINASPPLTESNMAELFESCGSGDDELTECDGIIPYIVDVDSMQELCAKLEVGSKNPVGLTNAFFELTQLEFDGNGTNCEVKKLGGRSVIIIQTPELLDDSALGAVDLAAWNIFLKTLESHEKNHKDIFRKNHQEAWEYIKNFETSENGCNEILVKIKNANDEFMKKAQEENNEYDKDTNSGISEGVVLPCG